MIGCVSSDSLAIISTLRTALPRTCAIKKTFPAHNIGQRKIHTKKDRTLEEATADLEKTMNKTKELLKKYKESMAEFSESMTELRESVAELNKEVGECAQSLNQSATTVTEIFKAFGIGKQQ